MNKEELAALRDLLTLRIPPSQELRELTRRLFARRGEGVVLPSVHFDGVQIHMCADNVAAWTSAHPDDRQVNGYLLFDIDYMFRHVRFTPHCVVKAAADGHLFDISPYAHETPHPFISHQGPDEEFWRAFDHGPMDFVYRDR
jgi:hypothetical protein